MEMRGKILRMGDEWCVCARAGCCVLLDVHKVNTGRAGDVYWMIDTHSWCGEYNEQPDCSPDGRCTTTSR